MKKVIWIITLMWFWGSGILIRKVWEHLCSFFKSIKVVHIHINFYWVFQQETLSHLRRTIRKTSCISCQCFFPNILIYHQRYSKINKNIFLIGKTPCNVLRFDVTMNDMKRVQSIQRIFQKWNHFLFGLIFAAKFSTMFHPKKAKIF